MKTEAKQAAYMRAKELPGTHIARHHAEEGQDLKDGGTVAAT